MRKLRRKSIAHGCYSVAVCCEVAVQLGEIGARPTAPGAAVNHDYEWKTRTRLSRRPVQVETERLSIPHDKCHRVHANCRRANPREQLAVNQRCCPRRRVLHLPGILASEGGKELTRKRLCDWRSAKKW